MLLFYSSMLCSTLVTSWWLFFPSRRHLAKPYFYTPTLPHMPTARAFSLCLFYCRP